MITFEINIPMIIFEISNAALENELELEKEGSLFILIK